MRNEVNRALVAKKKLTILFALLTLSAGMWAIDNVKYLDANGQEQTADGVTEVTDASDQVTWNAGWYVVTGTDVQLSEGAVCNGDVHLILADGAKLTATGDGNQYTPSIQVSGDGNSLTIYGQAIQSGQLIATGGNYSAGIGGGRNGAGSNITINGGEIVAIGGFSGPGIGSGSNGTAASNIKVATRLLVKAGANANPTTVVSNNGGDLASNLANKRYVTVGTPKHAVTYGENITVSPNFVSGSNVTVGTEITFTAADRTEAGYEFLGFYEEATFDTPITEGVSGLTYAVTVADAAIYVYAKYQQHISAAYIDAAGQEQTKDAIVVTSVATHPVTWTAGWYVVKGTDVQLAKGAVCSGAVNLILADGAKLTATGEYLELTAGIHVSGIGNSLTIYGQTNQSGELIATGGGYAAGIGGKQYEEGSNISIYGGTITATGYTNVSAIGGGWEGSGSNIKVSTDLYIKAGESANPTEVIDNNGGDLASDLDGKQFVTIGQKPPFSVTYGDYITVTPEFASGSKVAYGTGITFTAADRWEQGCEFLGFYKENTFENQITEGVSGLTYTTTVTDAAISVYARYEQPISTPYIDASGQEQTANAVAIKNSFSVLDAGWYVVTGSNVQTGSLTCNGAVHLILADGAKLTATGESRKAGIQVSGEGNSLSIYGQTNQSGQLIATGGEGEAAGIGGGFQGDGSNITINGGTITATGSENAAGIGGGSKGIGSNITINGGNVTATGGVWGAGIGGGWEGSGSNITINGGTVTATGGDRAAGIGGGSKGIGSNITINGGNVTATGGVWGAGIGGGWEGSGSNIKVATTLLVKADNSNPPTTEITNNGSDLASSLAGKRYATVAPDPLAELKAAAYTAGDAAGYARGLEEGKAEAQAALPTDPEGTAGHTVTITKGDKTLILINPDKVTYGKQE